MRNIAFLALAIANVSTFANEITTEQRIAELEKKLATLQTPTSNSTSANAFNPALSLILSGTFARYNEDPETYQLPGFSVGEESAPIAEGFALGESELTLSANIDDKFFGQATIAFANEDGETIVETEEAFVQTQAIYDGLTFKGGRFLSGIGYLNGHHAHTDAFIDRPLIYQTFFDHHFGDDGVQFRYVLPTDYYVELGAEWLRGDKYPAAGADNAGKGVNTQFAKFGGDIGTGGSYLFGLSRLNAKSDGLAESEEAFFSGDVTITLVDATFKWSPQGNKRLGQWVLRSEWLQEKRDGDYSDVNQNNETWQSQRSGYYVETQYLTASGWEFGVRHDQLKGDRDAPADWSSDTSNTRNSVMAGWRNSEFSRIQLQYSRGKIADDKSFDAWLLQYQMSIGAHGAHKF